MALLVLAALVGCSHGDPLPRTLREPSGTTAQQSSPDGVPVGSSGSASTIPGAKSTRSSSAHAGGGTSTSKSSKSAARPKGPLFATPGGAQLSGVICSYVSQSDVDTILPGAGAGVENDISDVAVSYCEFSGPSAGIVTVGVKNMGTSDGAVGTVRQKYATMSAEGGGQTVKTATVNGGFTFQVSSVTDLQSGADLYAVNAQGSRGDWYVNIQYYAHSSVSTSAMQHLLETVLSNVP